MQISKLSFFSLSFIAALCVIQTALADQVCIKFVSTETGTVYLKNGQFSFEWGATCGEEGTVFERSPFGTNSKGCSATGTYKLWLEFSFGNQYLTLGVGTNGAVTLSTESNAACWAFSSSKNAVYNAAYPQYPFTWLG